MDRIRTSSRSPTTWRVTLDLLVAETGLERHGVNLMLLFGDRRSGAASGADERLMSRRPTSPSVHGSKASPQDLPSSIALLRMRRRPARSLEPKHGRTLVAGEARALLDELARDEPCRRARRASARADADSLDEAPRSARVASAPCAAHARRCSTSPARCCTPTSAARCWPTRRSQHLLAHDGGADQPRIRPRRRRPRRPRSSSSRSLLLRRSPAPRPRPSSTTTPPRCC